MTMHQEWTDKLSEYVDGELAPGERAAVAAHLQECADCAAVLRDLKRVVAEARTIAARPPQVDLWDGIAARIERREATAQVVPMTPRSAKTAPRLITVSVTQLAAAAALIAAVSGGLVWSMASRGVAPAEPREVPVSQAAQVDPSAEEPRVTTVSLADDQYDAAVADLEQALKAGRGSLDASTIAIVEHNLQTIDQAIQQAREALAADPANTYLSSHLVEARRRKLDLLRRATALANEAD